MRAFSHILVPVDFTERNGTALARAVEIARPAARITLLHVIEEVSDAGSDPIDRFYAMLQRRAEQKMHALVEDFQRRGETELASEIFIGRRGPDILRYVVENGVDLVVMSSHALRANELSTGWATLSYQVSIICPCSVLLVK